MTHLRNNCSGIDATNALTIQADMMDFYDKAKVIPQYINITEKAQAKDTWSGLPITNNVLAAIDNRVMIYASDYLEKIKVINKCPVDKRTWANLKPTYGKVYTATQKSMAIRNEQGAPFGGMSAGEYKTLNTAVQFTSVEPPGKEIMESIAGYMNNLAGTITNGGSVF